MKNVKALFRRGQANAALKVNVQIKCKFGFADCLLIAWSQFTIRSQMSSASLMTRSSLLMYATLKFDGIVQNTDAAILDLEAVLYCAPEDKAAKAELTKLKRQQQANEAKLKGTFKKMFA